MKKEPSWYFPIQSGKYEVKQGLSKLYLDEDPVFEFDNQYNDFRQHIVERHVYGAGSNMCLENFYQEKEFTAQSYVVNWLCDFLSRQHPDLFTYHAPKHNIVGFLDCFLTGERLVFNSEMKLVDVHYRSFDSKKNIVHYAGAFDAVTSHLQEDVCVLQRQSDGSHWISAISLFCRNGWSAKDKIGGTFNEIHHPVALFGKIAASAEKIVNGMIDKGPFVRFAWGLHETSSLDRDPSREEWRYKCDIRSLHPVLRVERQLVIGLPEVNASIFTIRTHQRSAESLAWDGRFENRDVGPEDFNNLCSAIEEMPVSAQKYKGIHKAMPRILEKLNDIKRRRADVDRFNK